MKKESKNIAGAVFTLVAPKVEEMGYSLWDVEYLKEGTDWFLRITIDSPNGIELDDCEKVHRAIEPVIDEADPIEDMYYLEISSPGLERELKNDTHLQWAVGEKVEIKLYAPIDKSKVFIGILTSFDGEKYTVEDGTGAREIPVSAVAKIRTVYDFE
ncbi:MAG: ribosome maturation factor RimP [Clostridia bacterium]|nr:ribosome maturation factor RimP [Clostridia bacterium]